MRIVFMGTPDFAEASLKKLIGPSKSSSTSALTSSASSRSRTSRKTAA